MIVKSRLSSLFHLAFLFFWKPICIIPEKRSWIFFPILLNWFAESRTILYHFKRLIGSVPIGEGPRDVAQWRGWTPLSTSVCDSLFLCFFLASAYLCSCSFLFCSEHLISVNVVPLINLLNTFFYNKLLMHTILGPTDHVMVSELVDYLCKFVNAYQV